MKKILFFIFSLAFVGITFSQVTTSSIKGIISDENQAELPGANIIAVHNPTGTTYGAATNIDGRFNLLNMRVGGPYTVPVSYVGFQEQVFTDVYLDLGKSENISVGLMPDSEQLDAVVVKGNTSRGVFSKGRTGAETNVGASELRNLPSITRSASDYTRLEPTASGGSFAGRNDQYNNFSK